MEEFPPLGPVEIKSLSLEERMANVELDAMLLKKMFVETKAKMELDAMLSKKMFVETKAKMELDAMLSKDKFKKLLLPFCERELLILAGEILKWAVKKQGEEDGNGLQLFDPSVQAKVLLACRAYGGNPAPTGREVKTFQAMSQKVIKLRNTTAHYQDIDVLERMVKMSQDAIKQWPQLAESYPEQVQIVRKYQSFKEQLKDSFQ